MTKVISLLAGEAMLAGGRPLVVAGNCGFCLPATTDPVLGRLMLQSIAKTGNPLAPGESLAIAIRRTEEKIRAMKGK